MRHFFTSILLVAGLLAGCQTNQQSIETMPAGSANAEQSSEVAQPSGSRDLTAKLYVKGMSCPLCANNIDKQLLKVPGVKDVAINLGNGEVRAKLAAENPPTRDQLARAIDQSGFTLDRIEMPAP